jgi:hypothetical protein
MFAFSFQVSHNSSSRQSSLDNIVIPTTYLLSKGQCTENILLHLNDF